MMDEKVWTAVLTLADQLPVVGRLEGWKVAEIVTAVVPEGDLTARFATAVQSIANIEAGISAQRFVTAILPDGTNYLVKDAKFLPDDDDVESFAFNYQFPVFAETLSLAFGDGSENSKKR
jgi:hypothetical protein